MRRLLVNDALNQLGERTFWNDLQEWFGMEFTYDAGRDFSTLADDIDTWVDVCKDGENPYSLIVRNCSYFPPLKASPTIPTISLLQDIFTEGPMREMQDKVLCSSHVVFNSKFTASHYKIKAKNGTELGHYGAIIPLPVDFSVFEPQNAMGCQQALGLPDGCIIWVGASQGPAGHVKGFDIFLKIVRLNPDLHFVGVFKDAIPESFPPNLRCFLRLSHEELVKVIGACRVGLCTSRMESQHLAGIEMGGIGLPLVVPNVGCYWGRAQGFPGTVYSGEVRDNHPTLLASAITTALRGINHEASKDLIRDYWKKEFDREVIRKQWENLIEEVEGDTAR